MKGGVEEEKVKDNMERKRDGVQRAREMAPQRKTLIVLGTKDTTVNTSLSFCHDSPPKIVS